MRGVRAAIWRSQASLAQLSRKPGLNPKTVATSRAVVAANGRSGSDRPGPSFGSRRTLRLYLKPASAERATFSSRQICLIHFP